MKEKIVRKINRLGHFSQVIALILKIFTIICLLLLVVASVLSFGLPDEALEVTVSSNADISTDFGFTGRTISASDQQALLSGKGDISSSFLPGGSDVNIRDYLKEQGGKIEYKKVSDHFINAVVSNFAPEKFTMNDIRFGLLTMLLQTALFLICLFVGSSLCKALRYCDSPFEKSVIRRLRGFGFALLLWSIAAAFGKAVLDYLKASGDGSNFNIDFNLGLLFTALIVLALTRIFKYGALLQAETAAADAYDDYDEADDLPYDEYADDYSEEIYEALPADEADAAFSAEADAAAEPEAAAEDTYDELTEDEGEEL